MNRNRIYEADDLFRMGQECLNTLHIASPNNQSFLCAVNCGYFNEALRGLESNDDYTMPHHQQLHMISKVLNSRSAGSFIRNSNEAFWEFIEPHLVRIVNNAEDAPELWISYLVRLLYVRQAIEKGNTSPLVFTILLSALCDPSNTSYFGMGLLQRFQKTVSAGQKFVVELQSRDMTWELDYPYILMNDVLDLDRDDAYDDALQQMEASMAAGDFESLCNALEHMGKKYPASVEVFQARIYAAYVLGDKKFAAQLAHVARVLWPWDTSMHALCAEVLYSALRQEQT